MARRLDKTLVDYLVIAISPALIMTLIGSLVFFLLEVSYRSHYAIRLDLTFALFIFAAVLVARIAIEEGRERAWMFAIPLGIVAFLALQKFVQFEGAGLGGLSWAINLALIALILWCADKLTWDCTLIDETQRDSGRGLLQVVGLDRPRAAKPEPQADEPGKPEGVTSRDATLGGWWDRHLQRRRRPHPPGVWVVYFSLAALPLFGIGQLLIPPGNLARRQHAFCLLLVYVASGLGLLLTTSFLGLRRHLRQRRVEMPTAMANVWLVIGCILIVAVLIFAALLPRPAAEYPISRPPFAASSPPQKSSQYAVGSNGVEEDNGELHSTEVDQENESASAERNAEGEPKLGEGESEQKLGEQKENGESKPGSREEESQAPTGQEEKPGESRDKSDKERGKEPGNKSRVRPEGDSEADKSPSPQAAAEEPRRPKSETESVDDPARSPERQLVPRAEDLMKNVGRAVGNLLKWAFYIVVALIGVYWLWRSRAEILAALRGLLTAWHEFWQNLFGRGRKEADEAAGTESGPEQPLPRPFADFTDPFAAGTADRYSPDELVRYTFEALEAWAREHDCPRQPEQTPHEFARNVGTRAASLSRDARSLADLYCRVAYAQSAVGTLGTLPPASVDPLKQLWRQLRSWVDTPTGILGQ